MESTNTVPVPPPTVKPQTVIVTDEQTKAIFPPELDKIRQPEHIVCYSFSVYCYLSRKVSLKKPRRE